jgi:hypothetical protein
MFQCYQFLQNKYYLQKKLNSKKGFEPGIRNGHSFTSQTCYPLDYRNICIIVSLFDHELSQKVILRYCRLMVGFA